MAYWNVAVADADADADADAEYIDKYQDLKIAIQRAQTLKLSSRTKKRSDFWLAVELELKELKPTKQLKTRYKEE